MNEITQAQQEEVLQVLNNGEQIVQETDNYIVKKLSDGTFKKEMKYKPLITFEPKNDKEVLELYKIMNSNDGEKNDNIVELRRLVGEEITVEDVIINPYVSFDELTGENTNGVSTIMKNGDSYFATSSKSVYHSLKNFYDAFGYPNTGKFKSVVFRVTGTKREHGEQINLSLVSINK